MKVPKKIRTFCSKCRKHTDQKVERVKTSGRRTTSNLKAGSRYRLKKLHKGYSGSPYPMLEHGSKYGAKTSQKILLRYTCEVCKKKHQTKNALRAKKFEIVSE